MPTKINNEPPSYRIRVEKKFYINPFSDILEVKHSFTYIAEKRIYFLFFGRWIELGKFNTKLLAETEIECNRKNTKKIEKTTYYYY